MSDGATHLISNIENRGGIHQASSSAHPIRVSHLPNIGDDIVEGLVLLLRLGIPQIVAVDVFKARVELLDALFNLPEEVQHVVVHLQVDQITHASDHLKESVGVCVTVEIGVFGVDLLTVGQGCQDFFILHVVEFTIADVEGLDLPQISSLHHF